MLLIEISGSRRARAAFIVYTKASPIAANRFSAPPLPVSRGVDHLTSLCSLFVSPTRGGLLNVLYRIQQSATVWRQRSVMSYIVCKYCHPLVCHKPSRNIIISRQTALCGSYISIARFLKGLGELQSNVRFPVTAIVSVRHPTVHRSSRCYSGPMTKGGIG